MGGLCCANDLHTTKINSEIDKADRIDRSLQKLLLLGSGSSGKSTLFKQLKVIYKTAVKEDSTSETKKNVRKNLILFMLKLLTKSAMFVDQGILECHVDLNNDDIAQAVHLIASYKQYTFENNDQLDARQLEKIGNSMHILWSLAAIHKYTFERRNQFSFADNMDYFFDKCQRIFSAEYEPTFDDILRCRVRTTGMTKIQYQHDQLTFSIFDVGGQRNERRKWFNYFDGVTAIVFVAALNAYYSVIFEDEHKNAMLESLNVFREIANDTNFVTTDIILLLNKNDLFIQNLRRGISLARCFSDESDYEGEAWAGRDYDPAMEGEAIDPLPLQPTESETKPAVLANAINRNPSTEDVRPMLPVDDGKDGAITDITNELKNGGEQISDYFSVCYHDAVTFIREAYKNQVKNKAKAIYIHSTTATDQEIIKKVFFDVQSMIVRKNLTRSGFGPLPV